MISKHSCEQSGGGEGVEVVRNESENHPQYGPGQLTEKRIYLDRYLCTIHGPDIRKCAYRRRRPSLGLSVLPSSRLITFELWALTSPLTGSKAQFQHSNRSEPKVQVPPAQTCPGPFSGAAELGLFSEVIRRKTFKCSDCVWDCQMGKTCLSSCGGWLQDTVCGMMLPASLQNVCRWKYTLNLHLKKTVLYILLFTVLVPFQWMLYF